MELFQLLSILGLGGTLAAAALHFAIARPRRFGPPPGEPRDLVRLNLWERLVHAALVLSFLVLLVTSFVPALQGGRMTGYLLMLHTMAGAALALSLVAMMLTWAVDCRFLRHDGEWIRQGGCCRDKPEGLLAGRFDAAEKAYFWAAGILGASTLLTMMLSMVPLFGTTGQQVLYEIHRYSALVLVMATIGHTYRTTLAKPGTWRALLWGRVSAKWAKHYHALWVQPRGRDGG
jgi:formate dehydrogenase gamma subunit